MLQHCPQDLRIHLHHLLHRLPDVPHRGAQLTPTVEFPDDPPAGLQLIVPTDHQLNILFQSPHMAFVQKRQAALEISGGNFLYEPDDCAGCLFVLQCLYYLFPVLQILIPCFLLLLFKLLLCVVFDHHFLQLLLFHVCGDGLVIRLFPYPHALVKATGDDVIT